MKLLTKELEKQIPELYTTQSIPYKDRVAVVKLFHPASSWTWYILEYDGQDICYGLVEGLELEFGNFSLNELRQVVGPFGLSVERDRHFQPTKLIDLPIHGIERVVA
jgi:hypothetical protein